MQIKVFVKIGQDGQTKLTELVDGEAIYSLNDVDILNTDYIVLNGRHYELQLKIGSAKRLDDITTEYEFDLVPVDRINIVDITHSLVRL